jgi:hypothetical protein
MLGLLRGLAVRKGIAGDRRWLGIGVALWTIRLIRRLGDSEGTVIIDERLAPGETLVLVHREAEPTRRQRRKAAKRAEAEAERAAERAAKAAKTSRRKARRASTR